ncbi:hypothetical protein [Sinomonas terrae]|uniref:Uncharacterized protein n=1 Tax=Sinomonas terrae TaxID=2908838 RepID=A0ABS9TZQ5_9MICC|nr:hypothetical protein [Sinomonas terrae]MCH6469880.1 hypothetical protein [Sinomonas terrae]
MARKKAETRHVFALPEELVHRRAEHAASGASGVHADQKARRHRTGAVNRIGSRSSRTRAAIRNEGC